MVTDAVSTFSFVTEESGRRNLLAEGIPPDRIHLVSNLMIDSLWTNVHRARQSDILARLGATAKSYGLVTLHRPSNVDDPSQLAEIIETLSTNAGEVAAVTSLRPALESYRL